MQGQQSAKQGAGQVIALAILALILAAAYVALDFYSEGLKNVAITESRGSNIINGLSKHRFELGNYPETLDKLAPKFMMSVPNCPNGEPFAYQLSAGEYTLVCQKVVFRSGAYGYNSRTHAWGS